MSKITLHVGDSRRGTVKSAAVPGSSDRETRGTNLNVGPLFSDPGEAE